MSTHIILLLLAVLSLGYLSWSYTKIKDVNDKCLGLVFFGLSSFALIFTTSLIFPGLRGSVGMDILQIAISIVLCVNGLYWFFSGIQSIWDRLIGVAFLSVATGTPIIFTSLTRSVFEVSKLLNLRMALIWITVIVLIRAIVTKERIQLVKSSIHWPLIAYAVVTAISSLLSSNHYIALLGAYDRWDGLITELNYVLFIWFYLNFVKEKKTIFWLIGALLLGAFSSSVYGVFQSNGLDFMHWSVDPTARVFGCINNPVHYAPYIMMHVYLMIGFVFYFINQFNVKYLKLDFQKKNVVDFLLYNKNMLIISVIMFSIILMYYVSGYLSFGRATWIGASMSISFILYFLYLKDSKNIIRDMIFIFCGIGLINMIEVFKVYLAYSGRMLPIVIAMALICIAIILKNKDNWKEYLLYSLLIIYGGIMQFTMVSFAHLFINLLIAGLIAYFYSDPDKFKNTLKIILVFLFILSVATPSYEALLSSIQSTQVTGTEANVINKAKSYASDFAKGTARSSMWLTAIAAWKDSPILGTGPGMVKEIYPKYRRADYGRLEGGHNFTPDQFHNDYVSMLATRGILGFVVYFGWLIPLAMFLILRKIKAEGMQPGNYILAGLFAGLFVYLGQTIFNFGVVATRIIFYEFLCLALVIVLHDPFDTKPKLEAGK